MNSKIPTRKKIHWRSALKNEFGIHFKDSPDELQFLEAFIDDVIRDAVVEVRENRKNKK